MEENAMKEKTVREKAAVKKTGNGTTMVEIDLKKIFLTPPNTRKEKITLLVMMVVTFAMFFGPVCFSPIPPARAILLSCLPSLSISWGWMVFLRSLFRKAEFGR